MMQRFFVAVLMLGTVISFSPAGTQGNSGLRKSLPLDNVPSLVLKSRDNSSYLPGRLIIKLMPGTGESLNPSGLGINSIDDILSRLSVNAVEGMFPAAMAERGRGNVDLSRFIVVKYSAPIDPFSVSSDLSNVPEVQYAEPWFIYPVTYDPNDPFYSSQYGLTRIQANAAWDITRGDTATVIGIVDSGVQLGHPDLTGNIWHNPGEVGDDGQGRDKRTNGEDDDANGYIDDWQGWDFGGADYNNVVTDNNPSPTDGNNAHGTHVSGIASASTDNGLGVAGTAFNCRILAIKTAADNDYRGPGGTGFIIAGIQGIVYAAVMGADVMNCSWGGGGGSQVEQDLINFATDQGSLIVAAAGNSNSSAPHYPSAYQNVISVAATGSTDVRSSYSNYGHTIDVAAPGDAVYATWFPSTYAFLSGTSMASPHAAGSAALIKTMNPGFTALQVGEQLRVTADNINGINPSYTDLLGKGRVNVFRALTETPPSIRALNLDVSDSAGGNNNGNLEPNEVIDIVFNFTNFLQPTSNALVTLTETSAYVSIVNGDFTVGALGTLETMRNDAEPFQISIASNAPPGHIATFKLLMTDGTYDDFQWFTLVINPTFQSHDINDLHVTMTNNGRIGFNDYSANMQGIGVLFPASSVNHLFEGGLIIGNSATKLVNNIRVDDQQSEDNDFQARTIYDLQTPGTVSNQDGYTWYSDSLAPIANRLGLRLDQYTYAYSSSNDTDYVIVRYDITNLTASAISGLYVGQFYDWDIANYATNRTGLDAARSLAYAWDTTTTAPFMGVRALDSVANCRGLLNSNLTINRAEKWDWISGGTSQDSAGLGDIFFVISSGPYTIQPGELQRLGFAIIGGVDLVDLQAHADAARTKWDEILTLVSVDDGAPAVPTVFSLEQNYPNPFNPSTMIRYSIPEASFVSLKVFDLLGRQVSTLVEGTMSAGEHRTLFDASSLSSGVYFYRLDAGTSTATRKLTLIK